MDGDRDGVRDSTSFGGKTRFSSRWRRASIVSGSNSLLVESLVFGDGTITGSDVIGSVGLVEDMMIKC